MFAAPQTTVAPHPTGLGGLGEVALALIVVLAAIFVVAWLFRRMRIVGNRVGGGDGLVVGFDFQHAFAAQ